LTSIDASEAFPARRLPWGPVTARRLARTTGLYLAILLAGWILANATSRAELQALALGVMVPGGGFLAWADPGQAHALCAIGLAAGTIALFAVALVIWFATGNVVLPAVIWAVLRWPRRRAHFYWAIRTSAPGPRLSIGSRSAPSRRWPGPASLRW